MDYFKKRHIRKSAVNILRHAHHLRCMREDVMRESEIKKLSEAETEVRNALKANDVEKMDAAANELCSCIGKLAPPRPFSSWRENIEMIVVAVAVAMAFRTYFIQPFKIPTGSMQPTLYGIHTAAQMQPTIMDRFPIKLAKWLFFSGKSYKEIKVDQPGQLLPAQASGAEEDPSVSLWYVGDKLYKIPRGAELNYRPGQYLNKGDVLWAGVAIAGDHVFVNRMRWNFSRPKRGDVIVFNTDGIQGLPPQTHYIKRLVGMPNESVSINPPKLLINGHEIKDPPRGIERIVNMEPGYAGYQLIGGADGYLKRAGDSIALGEKDYFAMGDNTGNSKDGRYWGTVPEPNLVGPAVFVYWPWSKRWGRIQ